MKRIVVFLLLFRHNDKRIGFLFEKFECHCKHMGSHLLFLDWRFSRLYFFSAHTKCIVIISPELVYISYYHLSSCILPVKNSASHILQKFTKPPCGLVESCVGWIDVTKAAWCFGCDIFRAKEMYRLVYKIFSSLTITQIVTL